MLSPLYLGVDMAISAKEAVQAAFKFFDEFVTASGDASIQHKLLEELKLVDGNWCVVVGFDMGRRKTANAFGVGMGNETSPIREYRKFIINSNTGEMIELS
jgi:hypothetical protein